MKRVAVIGGGIAGLTAAYHLTNQMQDVVVFESSDRTGGVIHSVKEDGYLVEYGPNSIQTRTPITDELIDKLDLGNQRIEANASASKRYVVRDGIPVALPSSPLSFLRTPLFSPAAKLRLLREPFISPASEEESVAAFVRRRLGREFLDYAINPFVAGVFAGDPEQLSLPHAFPRLFQIEQQYGSLIRGMFRKARETKSSKSAMPTGTLISFQDGLQVLPDALASCLKSRIRTRQTVTRLRHEGAAWHIETREVEDAGSPPFDAVLFTAPTHTLSSVQLPTRVDLTPLHRVYYPPVSILGLGFRREQVRHPLDGFGMLIPAVESKFRILGALFSSTLFPGRAPDGHVLLTAFAGGARAPQLASSSTASLTATVLRDLGILLGVTGEPTFVKHIYWERAIPQYEPGYGKVKNILTQLEQALPGLFFAGNYVGGISVGDTITSGYEAAQRIYSYVTA